MIRRASASSSVALRRVALCMLLLIVALSGALRVQNVAGYSQRNSTLAATVDNQEVK